MGGRRLPHAMRLRLYRRVLELHNGGMSYRKIQKIIEGEYGVKISRSHISYWVRGIHVPEREPYNVPDLSKREELAWIAGMYAGDGSIKVNRKGRFLSLKVKDRELAEAAARKLSILMGREKPYFVGKLSDGRYYVEIQSRELIDVLIERSNVLNLLEERPVEFIQAFFDCEGYVTGLVSSQGSFLARIGVSNTDYDLMEKIKERLADLGVFGEIYMVHSRGKVIETSKGRSIARRNCYTLEVYRRDAIIRFHDRMKLFTVRKQEKLKDVVDILTRFGLGRRAAVEWIRRYEYRRGMGRQRWFRRKRFLDWEDALEEYERFLIGRKSNH